MSQLTNKRILITGASKGIGFALVKACLDAGARVSAFARSIDSLSALKSDQLVVTAGDVIDAKAVNEWVSHSLEQLGGIDVVINCAGVMYYQSLLNADLTEMSQMIAVNCLGFTQVLHETLPHLKQSTSAHVINITSDAGRQPFPGLAIYSGTKAFQEFVARAMRLELCEHSVKVTNIQPGNVATSLHGQSQDKTAESQFASDNKGQYLRTDDIVNAVLFALNSAANVAVNDILIEPQQEPI